MPGEQQDLAEQTGVITEERVEVQRPRLYRVILHNDDYTPMDFVVEVLKTIFKKKSEDAQRIMLEVHHHGQGLCGTYPYDIAEAKVTLTVELAQQRQFPLKCTMEPEEL